MSDLSRRPRPADCVPWQPAGHDAADVPFAGRSGELLDRYSERTLGRVWKAQSFSYWMTSMLHDRPGSGAFEHRRQLGELTSVVNSRHGSAYLAEAYTGWPSD